MNTILVLGAGRSSSSLIRYLLTQAEKNNNWNIVVADASLEAATQKVGNHRSGTPVAFDIHRPEDSAYISNADIVISLLPPPFHPAVASLCVSFRKHLLTASYVSPEMRAFHADAQSKGLIFLNECGLDPGIDHMSAMQIIDKIRNQGGQLTSFESFTGGLIAPDTDPDNPWRYKFTWNPKNVVMAGQGAARFLQDGDYKYIPYQQLFRRTTAVTVAGHGEYEGYANRDSLKYIETYDLKGVRTMLRGTLRNRGFCNAWNVLVQLGCCDDTYELQGVDSMTHADFINAFLPGPGSGIEEKLQSMRSLDLQGHEIEYLRWSGLFSRELIGLNSGSPAQILEHILNKKWKLAAGDKDQIVMWHRFRYTLDGAGKEIQASLVATGKDATYTAMADTVGLPLGIAARLILAGKVGARGVVIPTMPEIYEPVLAELASLGIRLTETE